MSSNSALFIALANAAVCAAVWFVCVCRIAKMSIKTRLTFRAMYVLMMVFMGASALQPITPPYVWPTWQDVLVNCAVFIFIASGRKAWLGGVPAYASLAK